MKLARRRPMQWLRRLWHWLRTEPCTRCGERTRKSQLRGHWGVGLFGAACEPCWQILEQEEEQWRYEQQVRQEMERLRAAEDARLRLEKSRGVYRGPE